MGFSASFKYEAIDKISAKLKKISDNAEKMEKKMKVAAAKSGQAFDKVGKRIGKVSDKLKDAGGKINTGFTLPFIGGVAAVVMAGSKYENALLSLSAITGVQGKQLNQMSVGIRAMSTEYGLGAATVAKGMELIGSKQPHLLKQPKLLASVAKSSAIMAKASGMAFNESAGAISDIMNQYGLAAKESDRVMNVLAAGSKFGAAAIPEITRAVNESGTAAAMAKISLESNVAAIEILAEKSITGSRAGNQLKNIFLKLEAASDKNLRPSVVGLSKALENLKEKNLTSAQVTKAFGLENVNAAQILIAGASKVEAMAIKIKGTTIATEQAEIASKKFSERWKKFKSESGEALISMFNTLRPMFVSIMTVVTKLASRMASFAKNNKTLVKVLFVMGIALSAVGVALTGLGIIGSIISSVIALGTAFAGTAVGTSILAAATKALSVVMAINPIGATVIALVSLVAIITLAWRKSTNFRWAIKSLWKSFKDGIRPITASLSILWSKVKTLFKPLIDWLGESNDKTDEMATSWKAVSGMVRLLFLPLEYGIVTITRLISLFQGLSDLIDDTAVKQMQSNADTAGKQLDLKLKMINKVTAAQEKLNKTEDPEKRKALLKEIIRSRETAIAMQRRINETQGDEASTGITASSLARLKEARESLAKIDTDSITKASMESKTNVDVTVKAEKGSSAKTEVSHLKGKPTVGVNDTGKI